MPNQTLITQAHQKAGAAVTAWLKAYNLAMTSHSYYSAALKLWTPARDATEAGRAIAQGAIDEVTSDPNATLGYVQSWLSYLVPLRDNDVAVLNLLGQQKQALLADLVAHAKISPQSPGTGPAVALQGPLGQTPAAPSGQLGSGGATLVPKPGGSATVTDPSGTVTVGPSGETSTGWGLGALAAAAAIGYVAFRILF